MKPAPFAYHRAESVDHALSLLHGLGDDAKLLAGGQSLAPMLNLRVARPAHLIDLNDLVELDSVRRADDWIEIGGMTRHQRVATDPVITGACPVLSAAAASIGHYAIRQRGTLGGSLSHADPAAQLPLIATLLNARIEVVSQGGTRTVAARDFFVASLSTALAPGEMVTAVHFPMTPPRTGWGFELFSLRRGDFAVTSVAALVTLAPGGEVERMSLALGGMATTPLAFDDVTLPHLGRLPDTAWLADIAGTVTERTAPDGDVRIPAHYRKDLAASLIVRALAGAVDRAQGRVAHA